MPRKEEERQAFGEAMEKDSMTGLEVKDADLSSLHDLANQFIMLGRDAMEALFELQQIRRSVNI